MPKSKQPVKGTPPPVKAVPLSIGRSATKAPVKATPVKSVAKSVPPLAKPDIQAIKAPVKAAVSIKRPVETVAKVNRTVNGVRLDIPQAECSSGALRMLELFQRAGCCYYVWNKESSTYEVGIGMPSRTPDPEKWRADMLEYAASASFKMAIVES